MIRMAGVSMKFGNRQALQNLSFEVRRGEVLGLVGHNGAGKTTALKILATLLTPSSGRIEICGPVTAAQPDLSSYKSMVGFLPDSPFLFEYLSGREMLHFLGSLYRIEPRSLRDRVEALLEQFNLSDVAGHWIKTYSRGTRRKLSVIGSILHEPLYWYLDEPGESLDPAAVRALKELIRCFRGENRAVVLSTHQLPLAEEMVDRLLILHQGTLLFDGTMESLQHRAGPKCSSLEEIYFSLVEPGAGSSRRPPAETTAFPGVHNDECSP